MDIINMTLRWPHLGRLLAAALVVWLNLCLVSSSDTPASDKYNPRKSSSLRLPNGTRPEHYDLFLNLDDHGSLDYQGQVRINLTFGAHADRCSTPEYSSSKDEPGPMKYQFGCNKRQIILNAHARVAIKEAKFLLAKPLGSPVHELIGIESIWRDLANELVAIRVVKEIPDHSRGQLVIDFTGQVGGDHDHDDYQGLYLSNWSSLSGPEVAYVTQFEPANARKAFPCFDEPQLKATFKVVIQHENNKTVLTNTLPEGQRAVMSKRGAMVTRTRFEQTPVMSTYLLAFSVGNYDHLESKIMDEKLLLRVFSPPGQSGLAEFALEAAERAYSILMDYFDIEQPLKKIDLMPQRMKMRAMENWGLVSISPDVLFIDRQASSMSNTAIWRADSMITIAHELAHHWFGNLVTMKWWDNLWLNEAFAQWMGFLVVNQMEPELNLNIYFVQVQTMVGLAEDAKLNKTHPIKNTKLTSIKDIEHSFDIITYNKGAAVLRMLEGYIGHENFKLAIRDYLKEFKFQNTEEFDLWRALDASSSLPVAELMETWLGQAGHPLVFVDLDESGKSIKVEQRRFAKRGQLSQREEAQLWLIPMEVLVVGQDGRREIVQFVLKERNTQVNLPSWFDATDPSRHWLKVNPNFEGFYRVQYGTKLWPALERAMRSEAMSPLDRMNLIDDVGSLYSIAELDLLAVETFLGWLDQENDPSVLFGLGKLLERLQQNSVLEERHLIYLLDYFNKLPVKFGFDPNASVLDLQARLQALKVFIQSRYKPVIDEASRLMREGRDIY